MNVDGEQYLKIKGQWAKIISPGGDPPKASGMGNGAMLALGAFFLGFLIAAIVMAK